MWTAFLLIILFKSTLSIEGISKQKCQEYSKAVYSQEISPILLTNSRYHMVSQCGIVEVPLIIGGKKAQLKEFPHMALIGFGASVNSKMNWLCGGALISEFFVLTAAHCMHSMDKGLPQKVKLGMITFETLHSGVQEIIIASRIPHPLYKSPSKYNDIALAKLANRVTFTPYVRPACISSNEIISSNSAIATGFGKTSFDAPKGSDNLMKVQLDVINHGVCSDHFSSSSDSISMPQGFIRSQICAGDMRGGRDTCQGDSGGPLQIVLNNPYCMYKVIGVTSFGKFCGFANSPAIYTNVGSFAAWIEKTVWG